MENVKESVFVGITPILHIQLPLAISNLRVSDLSDNKNRFQVPKEHFSFKFLFSDDKILSMRN